MPVSSNRSMQQLDWNEVSNHVLRKTITLHALYTIVKSWVGPSVVGGMGLICGPGFNLEKAETAARVA
jgi:hypothetical protein